LIQAVFENWRSAPIDERLRSAFEMLEELTRRPERFAAAQLQRMHEAGHDRVAIEDAAAVAGLFATLTRIADCLGFVYPSPASKKMAAARLLSAAGYGPMPAELRGPRRYAQLWADLKRAVETTPGQSKPELRAQVYAWIERDTRSADAVLDELPRELQTVVRKASRIAYQVSDDDVAALLEQGWTQAAVFEIVVALASAAGATRYAIAMDALDGYSPSASR
jgi:alkylhydroperoxidase family enzyme